MASFFPGLVYLLTRAVLAAAGLPFVASLDWMWVADPIDLRDDLVHTLLYFHAFPPGMNALTGMLVKMGGIEGVSALARATFLALGVVQVQALAYVGQALGLGAGVAAFLAIAFALSPAAIYFDHLFLYEWPVTTLLLVAAACLHRALRTPRAAWWLAGFTACAAVALTRSTFHLAWLLLVVAGAWGASPRDTRRTVLASALGPVLLVTAAYVKNAVLFGTFAISTFGPASFHLVTVDRLPQAERTALMREGHLSPFAGTSPYAPPRAYRRHFGAPDLTGWPPVVTRLEHESVRAPNFNHWFLLRVHEARRADVRTALAVAPDRYLRAIGQGLRAFFGPTTAWHPRARTPASPHAAHRAVLGAYDAWHSHLVHGFPWAPVGVYALLPLMWLVQARRVWTWRPLTPDERAQRALVGLSLFLVLYTTVASTMLTYFEWSRYRFQVEPFIWLLAGITLQSLIRSVRTRWTST